MIGAASWLLAVCLEKLQEISGAAAFFVVTQTAATPIIIRGYEIKVTFTTIDVSVNRQSYLLEQGVRKTQLQ